MTDGNPIHEFLKKEDLEHIFREAIEISFRELTERISVLVSLYTKTAIYTPWVWGFSSRWGLDFWAKQN